MTSVNIQSVFGNNTTYTKEQQKQFVGSEHTYAPNTTNMGLGWLEKSGQLVSRTTYAVLWEWVQATQGSQLVTDTEWLTLETSSETDRVDVYSSGDGSTTFRMPSTGIGDGNYLTTLFSGTSASGETITLSESVSNFDLLQFDSTFAQNDVPVVNCSSSVSVSEYKSTDYTTIGNNSVGGVNVSRHYIRRFSDTSVRFNAEIETLGVLTKVTGIRFSDTSVKYIYTGADTTTYSTTETFEGIIEGVVDNANSIKPIMSGQVGSPEHITAPQLLSFDDFWVDQGGIVYDSVTRRFTVPKDGVYRITLNPFKLSGSAAFRVFIGKNTDSPTAETHVGHCYGSGTNYQTLNLNSVVNFTAGDYFTFKVHQGTLFNKTTDRFTQFSVEFLG